MSQTKTPEQKRHLIDAAQTLYALVSDCCGFRTPLPTKATDLRVIHRMAIGVKGVCRRCYFRRLAYSNLQSAGDYDVNLDRLGLR